MTPSADVKAKAAVELFYKHLGTGLDHPAHVIKLVQFTHDSPGLRTYKRQIAEALVLLLESNGLHIHNGDSEAIAHLEGLGYTVTPPASTTGPAMDTTA